jgi:choline dehydrogenase-like flavoprotein
MTDTFDFVIVGAGSAGCVLANRLSEGGKYTVCVLEAGRDDNWIWFHVPVGYIFCFGNPRADWCLKTEADPGLNGRSISYPRGKVIGGSSTINAMIYMRGQAADYDGWRQMGLPGWGWDDVLPLFKKHEDHVDGASAAHGSGGELHVDKPRVRWDVLDAFRDAAEELGIAKIPDFNAGDNTGSSPFQVTQKHGRRFSAAKAFLKPAMGRANLDVRLEVMVDRLVLDGRRVTGVSYTQHGASFTVTARRDVILSAGAVATPAILERSGIGAPHVLATLGIEVRHALPGVGENLQDHLQLRPMFKVSGVKTLNQEYQSLAKRAWMAVEYALFRRGPMTMAPSQLGVFAKSGPEVETANLQFHVQPLSLDKFGDPLHPFPAMTASVCNLRPTSRGTVHARSASHDAPPVIAPNYLSTEEDRRIAVRSLRLTRDIMATKAMARFSPQEFRPGADLVTDDELLRGAAEIGTTIFHPVGTAKMGLETDPMAVTDARLRVHGLEGLRIVDASIMPRIVSGNTNAPTMMIGEKGSGLILEDARG